MALSYGFRAGAHLYRLVSAIDRTLCVLADNVEYGFDPHDDSDYLTIHGNDVWGNGEKPARQCVALSIVEQLFSTAV